MKTAQEVLHDIAFDGIKSACEWIDRNADRLDLYARDLNRSYTFRTSMEAELDKAEATLIRALESVRNTKRKYKTLEAA